MEGSARVFVSNVKNFVPGMLRLAGQVPRMLSVYQRLQYRKDAFAPTAVRMQSEAYVMDYYKRNLCTRRNMWVDRSLSETVSQKELAEFNTFTQDLWKLAHTLTTPLIFGIWSAPLLVFWLQTHTWVPSTFAQTAAERKDWLDGQDLHRYKYCPGAITESRWWTEMHQNGQVKEEVAEAWDEMWEKNDVRRDPEHMRQVARFWEWFQPFKFARRWQVRYLCRGLGIPTYPTCGKINLTARMLTMWQLNFHEDFMVIQGKLHETMCDEELNHYAWRRFLAPADKNLSREDVLQRVNDYHAYLGKNFLEGEFPIPNLYATSCYVMGYYNDPAFLDADFSELEQNDYEHLASWGKDLFMERLQFENGPLRDQVEAHSVKALEERKKKLEEP